MILDKNKIYKNLFSLKDWGTYYGSDINRISKSLVQANPEIFEEESKNRALTFFRRVSSQVPAYKDFLKKNNIDPEKIKTASDLKQVPWIDKENYLKQYPMESLCWHGKMTAPIISASSGSTGNPFFWPRSPEIERETTFIYELFLKEIFEINKYKTLLINGFSLGIYIGGTFTLNCSMRISQKAYPLTIITPGINKNEILNSIKKLHRYFDQIIISGYPPFIRDIIDDGQKMGINWKKIRLKFFFASESLSEEFRSYIYNKVGISDKSYYYSSMNLYGTADAAIMGHETPLSTFVRRLFSNNKDKCKEYFGTDYVPSLNQYYPMFKYIEIDNNEIILTSFNTEIPLVRYNIHDRGKVLTYHKIIKLIESFGYTEKKAEKITGRCFWHLPYVYLFGRSDFTVTVYGLNIYPENIKLALESKELISLTTGKFVLETANRASDQSQYLLIHIEILKDIPINKELEKKFREIIVKSLRKVNLEYNHLYQAIKERAIPKIDLRKQGDKTYFAPAIKQKWVKN
ncbi:MAG: hypothetical protein U5L76_00835 [Patescibacteria group bacterium]|nr:hypothetical protein [Patescibacteria group bacterium]